MRIRELDRTFSATIKRTVPFGVSLVPGAPIEFNEIDLDVSDTVRMKDSGRNLNFKLFLDMEEDELKELRDNIKRLQTESHAMFVQSSDHGVMTPAATR